MVTEGGNFIINIFFHIFAVLSYQDNSIAVKIDTFECISIFRKIYNRD